MNLRLNSTHIEQHDVSENELTEFFEDTIIFEKHRKDGSIIAIGKLSNNRYLRVIYRKQTIYDYFIINAYDIKEDYIKDFIDRSIAHNENYKN